MRESIARFIESQGHRTEISLLDESGSVATIHFRTRGNDVAVTVSEKDANYFSVSTAFELPPWAHDRAKNAEIFLDLQASLKAVKFFYIDQGNAFVAAIEQFSSSTEEFEKILWRVTGIVREAGTTALERILDSNVTKAAAEKFINEFMKGER